MRSLENSKLHTHLFLLYNPLILKQFQDSYLPVNCKSHLKVDVNNPCMPTEFLEMFVPHAAKKKVKWRLKANTQVDHFEQN